MQEHQEHQEHQVHDDGVLEIITAVAPRSEEREPSPETGCLLCGGLVFRTMLAGVEDTRLGTSGTYDIRQCVHCGLEQTSPVLSPEALKGLYQKHYNFGGEKDTLYTRWRERFFFSPCYRLWTWIDGDAAFYWRGGSGRLLDVGCNEGRGTRMYARNGFQAEGLDLNEAAAHVARDAGLTVHVCTLEEFHPEVPYDVVVLSNVLEHTGDPRQMLIEARRILADGGQVWISCPNGESWLRRMFGRYWINWHVPFHISHFTPKTMFHLLAETGFAPIEASQVTPASWVAQSFIAYVYDKKGVQNRQLRNPLRVAALMLFARFILFPALWLGNVRGRGDCLLAVAVKT
jgi:SAM-dependent methyltransferase